jgi:predicted nuclease of predicted toxin-antitoxin system
VKLKLDENLGARCRDVLVGAGHDVATVFDQGLHSAGDRAVIAACRTEGRCLVTLDLDFANPFTFPPEQFAGIVVLRLPRRPTGADIVAATGGLVRALARQSVGGKLWIVTPTRLREYSPEIPPPDDPSDPAP